MLDNQSIINRKLENNSNVTSFRLDKLLKLPRYYISESYMTQAFLLRASLRFTSFCESLADAVENDCSKYDSCPTNESSSRFYPRDSPENLFSQTAGPDHRCQYHHSQSHHDSLIQTGQYCGHIS